MSKFARRRLFILVTVAVVILGIVGYANRSAIRSGLDQLIGNDYKGSGYSSVLVEINPGDNGETIAKSLFDMGVVKNFRTVYKLILAADPKFYPGTYKLHLHMSSQAALDALMDPNGSVTNRILIKEGLRANVILDKLAAETGIARSEFSAAAKQRSAIGLPADAVSIEGYLFPATYTFSPKATAVSILKTMISRMQEELDEFGVSNADRHRVLTLASIIQKEARQQPDFYKVSRVFQNRINAGMHLQSDATVSYGADSNTVNTTVAQRAANNGFNTYLHAGLPIGPISSPGAVAIDAALHPASGSWLFFCAINLETGETVFSTTLAEHEKAVALWRAWMKEHPEYE
ncbi:MAG: endolytic transglycosylase MltG [Rhodoluna sp.]